MKTVYLILLFSVCFFSSCNKDDVPSIDEENTFSCKINGELFVPREHGGFYRKDGITVTLFPDNSWLFILGNGDNKIYMYLYNVDSIGSFNISESDGNGNFLFETANVIELEGPGNSGSNYRSIDNAGTINVIELDLNNRIIFEFENIQLVDNANAALNLTNGKLNVNLETLNQ